MLEVPLEDTAVPTAVLPDSNSRFSRLRSARSSAALWQRNSRSFWSALLMIRSNSVGTSGFKRTGATAHGSGSRQISLPTYRREKAENPSPSHIALPQKRISPFVHPDPCRGPARATCTLPSPPCCQGSSVAPQAHRLL